MNKSNTSILLVEDDRSLRELVTMVLELEGYAVTTANNGQEAIDYLSKHEVALIILDLFMPVLDGVHVMHWIRVEHVSDTPVLIVTAMADDKTRSTIMAAGANVIVKKPFDVKTLVQFVDELLKQ